MLFLCVNLTRLLRCFVVKLAEVSYLVSYYNTLGEMLPKLAQISFKLSRMIAKKMINIECSRVFIW